MGKPDSQTDHGHGRREADQSAEPHGETARGDEELEETGDDEAADEHAESDWGFSSGGPKLRKETKIGLGLILVLLGAFGFVLYRKLTENTEELAQVSTTAAAADATEQSGDGQSQDDGDPSEEGGSQTESTGKATRTASTGERGNAHSFGGTESPGSSNDSSGSDLGLSQSEPDMATQNDRDQPRGLFDGPGGGSTQAGNANSGAMSNSSSDYGGRTGEGSGSQPEMASDPFSGDGGQGPSYGSSGSSDDGSSRNAYTASSGQDPFGSNSAEVEGTNGGQSASHGNDRLEDFGGSGAGSSSGDDSNSGPSSSGGFSQPAVSLDAGSFDADASDRSDAGGSTPGDSSTQPDFGSPDEFGSSVRRPSDRGNGSDLSGRDPDFTFETPDDDADGTTGGTETSPGNNESLNSADGGRYGAYRPLDSGQAQAESSTRVDSFGEEQNSDNPGSGVETGAQSDFSVDGTNSSGQRETTGGSGPSFDTSDDFSDSSGIGNRNRFETGSPAFGDSSSHSSQGGFGGDFGGSGNLQNGGVETYTIQQNDNYWNISKKKYGTPRYFSALARYNEEHIADPKQMRPGMTIELPRAEVLRSRYPDLTPPGASSSTPETSGRSSEEAGSQEQGFFTDSSGKKAYRVGDDDTLTGIARAHLGRASRWIQIYHMNRDRLKNPDDLQVGTVLRLPADASRVRLVRGHDGGR